MRAVFLKKRGGGGRERLEVYFVVRVRREVSGLGAFGCVWCSGYGVYSGHVVCSVYLFYLSEKRERHE